MVAGEGDAVPGDADVLQDRTDLSQVAVNRSTHNADAAQEEYVKSLVTRSGLHRLSAADERITAGHTHFSLSRAMAKPARGCGCFVLHDLGDPGTRNMLIQTDIS